MLLQLTRLNLLVETLIICLVIAGCFLDYHMVSAANIYSGGPVHPGSWRPHLLPASSVTPGYLLHGEAVEEAEIAADHCLHHGIAFCLPQRSMSNWIIERTISSPFSFFNWWNVEQAHFGELPSGSLAGPVYRAIPIVIPGIGHIGAFMITWTPSIEPLLVEVRVEMVPNLPARWTILRGRHIDLETLAINWSIVFLDEQDSPVHPVANSQYMDDHPLARTRYGLWTWQMGPMTRDGARTGTMFQRRLSFSRLSLTAGTRRNGRYVRIYARRLVFDYAVAALENILH